MVGTYPRTFATEPVNAPYYQWGRKDPLLASNGIDNTQKPYYDNQYAGYVTISGAIATNIAIQHPNTFYIGDSWSSTNSLEYWNKGNTLTTANNSPVKKTIYSPSPNGYLEPCTAAFTGFTTTGGNTTNSSQFNVYGPFNIGWNFYCQPNFTGGTVFFSALGYIVYNTGTINAVSISCNYWTAGPSSNTTYARLLGFHSGLVTPLAELPRAFGFISRPISE